MELFEYVGSRIREYRTSFSGMGLSQEQLAELLKTSANTISRWETGTYRPALDDLANLSRVFGVSITAFFPSESQPEDESLEAALRAVKHLPKADLDEIIRYAHYRHLIHTQPEFPTKSKARRSKDK